MAKGRLQTAASLLPRGGSIADVGAGDGALSLLLAAQGRFTRIVATEAAEGPFSRLRAACEGVCGITPRFGRGLSPLRGDSFDGVAILGMGAGTILEILVDAKEHEGTLFVLGPMQHAPRLRAGLQGRGLAIVDERLATEGDRVYELIAARRAPSPALSFVESQLGPILLRTRPEGFDRLCVKRLGLLRAQLKGARNERREELLSQILEMEDA